MYRSLSTVAAITSTLIGAPSAFAIPHFDGVVSADLRALTQGTVRTQAEDTPRTPQTRYERMLRAARREYRVSYRKAKRQFGVQALGRNIERDGVQHQHGARHAHVSELRESTARLQSMLAPAGPPAAGDASATPAVASGAATPPAYIAQCESGGDPTAISPGGTYRGKWQMDQQTWESAGGTGDPAAAPEAVQDAVAANLYEQRGTQPWGCG
jgi:hypothetical protein